MLRRLLRSEIVRRQSTLAEEMLSATEGRASANRTKEVWAEQHDAMGERFRPVYLGPKRKLRTQLSIERETGRAVETSYPRADLLNRMSVRRPRREEMSTEQDWPSVWPAAQSFRYSVVPLPVRMGARRHPERRAPFKTEGNLELVKIPNFLHLTPAAIERHCKAIKKFCTKWPENMTEDVRQKYFPLKITYSDYVHQGNSLRDMRSRIIIVRIKVSSLNLDEHALDKLARLAGSRYNRETDILTIVTDRCYTRKQNRDYAMYLLAALYTESNKVEEWEKLADRSSARTIKFEGSEMKEELVELLFALDEKCKKRTADQSDINRKIGEFASSWEEYRNKKETPETVRQYAKSVKQLLGIPIFNPEENENENQTSATSS